jgi:hypothetical protein
MTADRPSTMFASPDRKRFFYIPDDEALPSGSYTIRNLKGEKREVEEAALTAFEVDEVRAKEIVKAEVARIARKTQEFLAGASAALRAGRPVQPGEGQGAPMNLAAVLGMTPDEMRTDPKKAVEAMKNTLRNFAQTVRDAAPAAAPTEVATSARDRIEAMSNYLNAQGSEFAGSVEALPERLAKFLTNPALEEQIRQATRDLKAAAAELRGEKPAPETPSENAEPDN